MNIPIIGERSREVEELTDRELFALQLIHEFCQKHNVGLICVKCQAPLQGYNTGNERYQSVRCKCREWKADVGSAGRSM